MTLPPLLAGPILRRTTSSEVCVWVATTLPPGVDSELVLTDAVMARRLPAHSNVKSIRLGQNVFVTLIRAKPADAALFPSLRTIAYDVRLALTGRILGLRELIKGGGRALAVGTTYTLPTFQIGSQRELRLFHASCRKAHGENADAATPLLAELTYLLNTGQRPSALFLTGDQIYADDVAAPLLNKLTKTGKLLLGWDESIPVSTAKGVAGPTQWIPVSKLPSDRTPIIRDSARMTTTDATNHLIGLGEYLAMYFAMWNPDWPIFPTDWELSQWTFGPESHRRKVIARRLKATRDATPALRTLMANIPTYMIFDDHEVTDDWNLDQAWVANVLRSTTGKRIVANAMTAYWACQHWGNAPDQFPASWIDGIERYAALQETRGGAAMPLESAPYELQMWNAPSFSYVAPTLPPTLVVDTRTRRALGMGKKPSGLLTTTEMDRVREMIRDARPDPNAPLIIVTPSPFIGHLKSEQYQETVLLKRRGKAIADLETWRGGGRAWLAFLDRITGLGAPFVVVLSGDVHYAYTATSRVERHGRMVAIHQLTSSALHNESYNTRFVVAKLQKTQDDFNLPIEILRHGDPAAARFNHASFWGFAGPLVLTPRQHGSAVELLLAALRFAPSAPKDYLRQQIVRLAPSVVKALGITVRPEWKEHVRYWGRDTITGINNAGSVVVGANKVEQTLISTGHRDRVPIIPTK